MPRSILAKRPVEPERLLTLEELAKLLNVAPSTVTLWVKQKRFPYYRLAWQLVRVRLSDVEAYLEHTLVPARQVPIAIYSKRGQKPKDMEAQEACA